MEKINDGGSAFARPIGASGHRVNDSQVGMSLRDFFANHADISQFNLNDHIFEMRAARATYADEAPTSMEIADAVADLKVMLADALLRRLARGAA